MQEEVRKDILNVVYSAVQEIRRNDNYALSELSNHVIHDLSIYQDEDSASIAVLVYALAKMVQHCSERGISYSAIIPLLQKAHGLLESNKYNAYAQSIRGIFKAIERIDGKLKLYIQEVFTKARINKGAKLYEHGVSIARTAELLGVSQWELMDYIGKTRLPENAAGISVRQRLANARELFE